MHLRAAITRVLTVVVSVWLLARPASAASLQQVTSWGATGVPTYVAMYIYVPDKLATNPPVLVVAHYCGGDAQGVFGEAKGGGIVDASDKYGFIMIYPQNHQPGTTRNCWDVGSTKSLTHDGGGDTQAIAQMVKYTLTKYSANANRVYVTGTSSGAMMTEALLAVYPDVFKAGAEFAGVPAGCWAASYTDSNQWSGPCAGGQETHTAQQWGDMVRNMYKGYSGYRPRVQLWHGLADPTISPTNHTEAIKEWTNVLGLPTNPTSTTTVSLANHQWTRQTWNNACGSAVLDAWGEMGGPHGTDANFNAQYTIPFLGLDKTGDVDPVIAGCPSDGGAGGAGGAGGSSGASDGGAGNRDGGSDASGGGGRGGATGTGGSIGTAGRGGNSAGGNGGTGGNAGSAGNGGNAGTTGTVTDAGTPGAGGNGASGQAGASGGPGAGGRAGTTGVAGNSTTSGSGGSGSGGIATTGAAGSSNGGNGGSAGAGPGAAGCSCGVATTDAGFDALAALALTAFVLARRRRTSVRARR